VVYLHRPLFLLLPDTHDVGLLWLMTSSSDTVAPLWFQQWDQQHFQPLVNEVATLCKMLGIHAAQVSGQSYRSRELWCF